MSLARLMRDRLRVPSRLALLLGFGAISASGVQAAVPEIGSDSKPQAVPQQGGKAFGELAVWIEGERIYFSESGKAAQELRFGNTPEANYLRELLKRDGANAAAPRVVPDRMIFVGSGGAGIGWVPAGTKQVPATSAMPATGFDAANPTPPVQTSPLERSREPAKTHAQRTQKKG